jgi:hypothetical protein
MKMTTGVLLMLALGSGSAFAVSEADAFGQLSPQDALEQAHQWHKTGEASVKILPDVIQAKFSDNSSVSIPVKDEFLLSIAPYVNRTHSCTYHVPTGCQGELVNQAMMVEVKDTETNKVVQKGMVKTQKDGFIDFWMPKNKSYQFTFHYQGKAVSEVLTTGKSDRTCITTMKLI